MLSSWSTQTFSKDGMKRNFYTTKPRNIQGFNVGKDKNTFVTEIFVSMRLFMSWLI